MRWVLAGSVAAWPLMRLSEPTAAWAAPPAAVNVCTGLGVTLPVAQPVATTTDNLLTGILSPIQGDLNSVTGNVNASLSQALDGQTLGIGVIDPSTGTLASVSAANCNLTANSYAVANNQGVSLGGGVITGLGGTGNLQATAGDATSIAIGNNAMTATTVTNAVAIGAGANAQVGNSVALGANSIASTGALSGYNAFGTSSPQTSAGEVSVGSSTAQRQITNVAAGLATTDAVNVGQLRGTSSAIGTSVANALGGGTSYNTTTGAIASPSYTIHGVTYNNVGSALGAVSALSLPYVTADPNAGTTAAIANGLGSTTLGYNAAATGTASTVVGNGALDNGVSDSTVIGNGAGIAAGLAGSNVALGQGALASTGALSGYSAFGLAPAQTSAGEVSVGTTTGQRQITNLAAGRANTDAVNVGQLRGTASNLGTSVATALGGSTTYNTTTGAIGNTSYTIRSVIYNNVGSALTAIDNSLGALVIPYVAADATAGTAASIASGAGATTLGYNAAATGAASTVIGNGALDNGVANSTVIGNGASVVAGLTGSNVALGQGSVASTGALSGYSAFGLVGTQNAIGEVSVGTSTGQRRITNLAAGSADNDAVNVGQLRGTASNIGTSVATAFGGSTTYNTTTGAIANTHYTVRGNSYNNVGSALGAIDTEVGALPAQYSTAGAPTTPNPGVPSNDVTLIGAVAGGVVLHNVAPGAISNTSTDAINGSQIYAGNHSIATILGGGATYNVSNSTVTDPSYTIRSVTYNNVGSALTAIDNSLNSLSLPYVAADATAGTAASIASGAGATTLGYNAAATGAASTVIGNGALDNGVANSTVIGNGASVVAGLTGSNVALGQGSVASTGALSGYSAFGLVGTQNAIGEVSVGTSTGQRRITNLAAGSADTDAVNVGQLRGTASNIGTSVATAFGGSTTYNTTTGAIANTHYTVRGNSYNNVGSALGAIDTEVGALPAQYSTAGAPTTPNPGVPSNDVTLIGAVAGGVVLHNVAPGAISNTSTDAINGSQIYAGNHSIATILGGGATYNVSNSTVSDPSYTIRSVTYNNVGSALTAIDNSLNSLSLPYVAADATAGTAASVASGAGATTLGYNAAATGAASTVIGNGALDNGVANSTVIGNGASVVAGLTGSNVALGQGSVASTGALSGYSAFGLVGTQNAIGEVSVGTSTGQRRITNLAAGLADTDAVNVGQLRGTATSLGTSISIALGGNSTYDTTTGAITNTSYKIRGSTYNNVGSALTAIDNSFDSVSLAYAAADATAGTTASVASGAGATTLGYNAAATGAASTVIGNGALDNGVANSTVIGSGASIVAGLTGSNVAIGQGAVASTGALSGYSAFGLVGTQTSVGEVSVGSATGLRQITNLAAGLADTDAVNVGQLRGSASNLGTSISIALGGSSTYNMTTGAVTSPSYVIGGTTYTTVGTALNALSQSIGTGGAQPYFQAKSTLAAASATGTDTVAIGPVASAGATNAVAIGNGAGATGAGSVALGAGSSDQGAEDVVSVGAPGAERKITNVAAGDVSATSTDAVNGAELYAVSTEMSGSMIHYDAGSNGKTTSSISLGSDAGTPVVIHNLGPGVADTDAANMGQLRAATANAVQYDTSGGLRTNMITLAGGQAGGVTIGNVADGVASGDAVNLGQLQSASSDTLAKADAYTDRAVNNLAALTEKDIRQARADAAGGTALALAATGVRYDDHPGKMSISGAAAYYHDQMGLAFGIGQTSEDGRFRFNASISASPTMTNPDVGAVVGASVSLN